MFSMLNILLVTRLLLMSDRDQFWETDKIAKENVADKSAIDPAQLKDKKILLVVHGFNNTAEDALESYRTVARHVESLKDTQGEALYDYVIGYLWPGYDSKLEYYPARRHAAKLKDKMQGHLQFLLTHAAKIDVMAHSMGNRLMFEALNMPLQKKAKKGINNFYALAAAVDNESLEKNSRYFHVTENCNGIFIFHSKQDDVLEYLYALAEWDKALGFEGTENLSRLPGNVQLIDCTSFITGHSQYFASSAIYSFIRSEWLKQAPLVKEGQRLKMLATGDVEILVNIKK
jgi:esterase/lipase superfamily enzyme